MRRFGGTLGLFLLAVTHVGATAGSNCLWRVTDGQHQLYVQGSVHLLRKDHYPLAKPIEAAFAASDVLVLEIDLTAAAEPAAQRALLSRAMITHGVPLQARLSEATRRMARKELATLGVTLDAFDAFKPWYFAMAATLLKLRALGFDPEHGVDRHFLRRAVEAGKPVIGLETLDYQIGLFDELAVADQEALVRRTFLDFDLLDRELDRLVRAWADGDVATLDRLLMKHFREYPKLHRRFVVDRNRAWMPKLEAFLQSGRIHMVVVGAGHLGGEQGLVALLRARGYRLEHL